MAREGKGDLGPTAEEIKSGILGTGAEGIAAGERDRCPSVCEGVR